MNEYLSITIDDIKSLADNTLEDLVAELCRCELIHHGLHTSAITAGGELTSTDGGIDVMVSLRSELPYSEGFIPRRVTGFQVKKHSMPASKIAEEMKPKGELRPSIDKIAAAGGSYIIVSGRDNVSKSWKDKRVTAMRKSIGGLKCHVDFYDSDRIARWVKEYPSMIAWVRQRCGRPLAGWSPFGDWTQSGIMSENTFVIDDKTVLRSLPKHEEDRGVVALEKIRNRILKPRSVTRIIGLSGVGKTRFLQALFEEGIKNYVPLPKENVVYTNNSENVLPTPSEMLAAVATTNARTVIIVDNCSGATHRRLTSNLKNISGNLSLVTVEHEIKDSLPEDTKVFKLEPGSEETVRKVISSRFPKYERTKIERIVRCAGGNFRIAIAIAKGVGENYDVSTITDDELFDRIFYQDGVKREQVTDVAQVLSLLYSFDFADFEDNSEIAKLGALIGLSVDQMYDGVSYLEQKDLIQARGKWRAVLPHALANRLAGKCLARLRPEKVAKLIEHPENGRIMKSFANRIGFMKGNSSARRIVIQWLSPGGYLDNIFKYDADRTKVLKNAAIVEEVAVLQRIEEWTANSAIRDWIKTNYQQDGILQIATYLGHDPKLFYRALKVLLILYSVEEDQQKRDNQKRTIARFFQLRLSGTLITPKERQQILTKWLDDQGFDEALLKACLQGYLETKSVYGHPNFDREKARGSTGYRPLINQEVIEWYRKGVTMLRSYAAKESFRSSLVNDIFIDNFSSFWRVNWLYEDVELFIEDRITEDKWKAGLLPVSKLLAWPNSGISADQRKKLEELKEQISPKSLREQIETYVLFDRGDAHSIVNSLETTGEDGVAAIHDSALVLGIALSHDLTLLKALLPQLLSVHNYYSSHSLGRGLISADVNREAIIRLFIDALKKLREPDIADYNFAKGFIGELFKKDSTTYHSLMDLIVEDENLRYHAISCQASHVYDDRDVERLDGIIGDPAISMRSYSELSLCSAGISDVILQRYLNEIASMSDEGVAVAIGFASKIVERKQALTEGLKRAVIDVSSRYALERSNSMRYRHASTWLITIIENVYNDSYSFQAATALLESLKDIHENRAFLSDDARQLLVPLSERHPRAVLDVFVSNVDTDQLWSRDEGFPYLVRPIVTALDFGETRKWILKNPKVRRRELSFCITPFDGEYEETVLAEWGRLVELVLSDRKHFMVVKAHVNASIDSLNEWGSDLAEKLVKLLPSLQELTRSSNSTTKVWASSKLEEVNKRIEEASQSKFRFFREPEEPRFE